MSDIDALRKQWVNPNGPAQWVASVDATLPTDSEELNQRWRNEGDWEMFGVISAPNPCQAQLVAVNQQKHRIDQLEALIELLHREIVALVALPEVETRLDELGFEVVASSPQEFAQRIKTEMEKWSQVIRDAKIKAQDAK